MWIPPISVAQVRTWEALDFEGGLRLGGARGAVSDRVRTASQGRAPLIELGTPLRSYDEAVPRQPRTLLLIAILCLTWSAATAWGGVEAFNGRWIIRPLGENNGRVLWLEVNGVGTGSITGAMVGGGPGGQLDPIRDARIADGQLQFRLERTFTRGRSMTVTTLVVAALERGSLFGVADRGERGILAWAGERAPVLPERDDGTWNKGAPIELFDGTGVGSWHTLRPGREDGWFAEDGILKNRKGADVLVSDRTFWNFELEVEFLMHPKMNGGIGLRGRYEIQLLDDFGKAASDHGNGALYGRIKPSQNASRKAGEWQTLVVRLVGREVTVTLNGITTIDREVVEGFTAMATDWREDEAGPITLQGDHGAVEFRRIAVTPLSK